MPIQPYLPGLKPVPPYPNVDGWPILNHLNPGRDGYMSGWIHRRLYPSAIDALEDARLAARRAGIALYVVKHKVPADFQKYWPDKYNWQISENPPFHGQSGDFYLPQPEHYIIDPGALVKEIFVPGEKERR